MIRRNVSPKVGSALSKNKSVWIFLRNLKILNIDNKYKYLVLSKEGKALWHNEEQTLRFHKVWCVRCTFFISSMMICSPLWAMTPSSRTRFLCCSFLEKNEWTLNFMSQWLLEEKRSAYSRHDCSFQQEGLSCDITFDDLYCHLLADILSFINSCNSESAAFVKATITL